ncbi:hypothetical protein [Corallococcus macrosporus]|uniref:Uncharacterized protein n=1 Tax=Myxococcus fulvus (strain ATCC BAA-855 / HW-1) TaxID=483219 RepID=F8CB61_MYXFH|nr:hypothetical protein [Corallococcus macrosporus]AEI62166.1 hypothetical protein LILAB_01170 [Corallococcus macrosporus]
MENTYGTMNSPGGPGAQEAVSLPAILLMVLSGITVLLGLVNLLQSFGGTDPAVTEALQNPDLPEGARRLIAGLSSTGGKVMFALLTIALNGLIFFGALKMKNLQSHGLAMTAAIISVIPCCSPCACLGIPVGIWALVVLNKPEVKASFT